MRTSKKLRLITIGSFWQLFFLCLVGNYTTARVVDQIANDDYSNQLRYLRLLLGPRFRPISTATLAGMVRLPPVAIRGIEAGRRVLNDEDRHHINAYLGAHWAEDSHQWVCAWNPKLPYSREQYDWYSAHLDGAGTLLSSNQKRYGQAVEYFLSALPAKEANFELLKWHHQLLDAAKANELVGPDVVKVIEACRPITDPTRELGRKKKRPKRLVEE